MQTVRSVLSVLPGFGGAVVTGVVLAAGVLVGVLAGAAALRAYGWGAPRTPTELDLRLAQARASVRASALASVQRALAGEIGEKHRVAALAAIEEAGVDLAEAPSRIYSLMLTILIDHDEDVLAALVERFSEPNRADPHSDRYDDPHTARSASCGDRFPSSALTGDRCPRCAGPRHHHPPAEDGTER